ncbi:HEPN domain-containing protein [Bradyrhizobium sp. WD16]|uniref:HEPN domain-containing protein n=1 Tax=Bradyrhizobium sp. WD16 TaxID=1521768 RepID=UPI0020A3B2C7|nr:HEPN domain-containing protein [Bradyrhizobium sp. WD16]
MSLARSSFYEHMNLLRELSSDSLLTDVFPPVDAHNARAKILRNGLVVSSFSLLEHYVQGRLDEKIAELSSTRITYSMFDDKMRSFLSMNAVLGLGNRINFTDKSDRLSFAETHITRLAAIATNPPSYTGLGFSPKGSNVSGDDLRDLLAAFGIQNAWRALSQVVSSLGATRVSLKDDFVNLSRSRNRAAHRSTTNLATADLQTHLDTAVLVGLSIDILLSNAINAFIKERTAASATASANSLPLNFRFLDQQVDNTWNEKVGSAGRVVKKYPSRMAAVAGATARAAKNYIVVRDLRSIPVELL